MASKRAAMAVVTFLAGASATAAAAASTNKTQAPCRVRDLQPGYSATCLVLDAPAAFNGTTLPAGGAMCFGYWPLLGAGVSVSSDVPLPVAGLATAGVSVVTMKAGAGQSSCGLFVGSASKWKQLRCTGFNSYGLLGCGFEGGGFVNPFGQGQYQLTPCDAVGLPRAQDNNTEVKGVAMSRRHTVAWLNDGRVFAAGERIFNGRSGDAWLAFANFSQVANLSHVSSCAAGEQHTCCIINTGGDFKGTGGGTAVKCWGYNGSGQLGVNNTATWLTATPEFVPGLTGVVQLAAGRDHTAALLANGSVVSWGTNAGGELGDGSKRTSSSIPVLAANLTNVAQISAGGFNTCARLTTGVMRCWGYNADGQVGSANCTSSCTAPQPPVPGVSGVASVGVGEGHVCVVYENKTASCWGRVSWNTTAASPGQLIMCEVPSA